MYQTGGSGYSVSWHLCPATAFAEPMACHDPALTGGPMRGANHLEGTVPEQWKDGLEPIVADQVDYISEQFDRAGHEIGLVPADGGVGFLYAEGQILVRSD